MPGAAVDDPLRGAISGAEAYERLHVPALFREWAPRVLDAAEVADGDRVLDVACGTGVLARAALERVGPSGSVVGLDPDAGMLTVAARLNDRIEWREGTAETVPFADVSFDRVVSQFGMMFFPDPEAAVEEMTRVLTPSGRFAIAVWDSLESSPAYTLEVELLERMVGVDAADALRAPFVLGDVGRLCDLIGRAVGAPVESQTLVGCARFPSIRSMVEADLRGWLPVMGVQLDEALILDIVATADQELVDFVLPDGRVEFDVSAHIVSGGKST